MAEINTGTSSSGGFIFGQNMEDRVIKPQDEEDKTEENGASGNSEAQDDKEQNKPLKASAFKPSSGLIAPSKLGTNPFVGKAQNAGASEGVLATGRLAHNPFAEKAHPQPLSTPSSDSEDEKREKPIVAPTHFSAGKLATPKIVFTADQSSESTPRAILRPSILDKQTANFGTPTPSEKNNAYKSSFKLEPARLSSPLAKDTTTGETESDKKEVAASETEEGKNRLFGSFGSGASKENDATTAAKDSPKDSSENGAKSGPSFVFGQNMEQRVTNSASSGSQENSSNLFGVFGENISQRVVGVVDSPPKNQTADTTKTPDAASPTQTLEESAAAHQAKQSKPELQEVEVKTGEENESNVFQITTKLYAFDKDAQSWLEKGRGILRLNDMLSEHGGRTFKSRLVMRTQGSLRVVLNTKIWAGMMVERASQKSIRISAMDEDGVKVFLVMANPKESDQIFKAIDWRVQQLKMREPKVESSIEGGEPTESPSSASKTPEKGNKSPSHGEKRRAEPNAETPVKKARIESDQRRDVAEESNDSSTPDPETEASNESFTSTNKSSSSE